MPFRPTTHIIRRDDGVALVIVLMALLLLTALGVALTLNTSIETLIAGNVRENQEAFYAAEAGIARAIDDLSSSGDWNAVLDGVVVSPFTDGPPDGLRVLADGSTLDLAQTVNMANCGAVASCSLSQMDLVTTARPWGPNNPRWRPYAYGNVRNLLPPGASDSSYYIMVLVADDASENDNDPLRDGANPSNPGSGVLALRAEAFGPRGARKSIEATVARASTARIRLMSWHQVGR